MNKLLNEVEDKLADCKRRTYVYCTAKLRKSSYA